MFAENEKLDGKGLKLIFLNHSKYFLFFKNFISEKGDRSKL